MKTNKLNDLDALRLILELANDLLVGWVKIPLILALSEVKEVFILPELTGKVLRLDFIEGRVCVTKRLLDLVVVKFKHVQF